jgi:hypothetical protein
MTRSIASVIGDGLPPGRGQLATPRLTGTRACRLHKHQDYDALLKTPES